MKTIHKNQSNLHYADNEAPEGKIKRAIPSTRASKRTKHPSTNLTKDVNDGHTENCKSLNNETLVTNQ